MLKICAFYNKTGKKKSKYMQNALQDLEFLYVGATHGNKVHLS